MKWDGSFEGVFYKKQFDVFSFKFSRERTEFDREIKKLRNWLAKISAPSFKDLPNELSKPAALDGFKPFKIFNIASGDVSENSKFEYLNSILA